MDENAQICLLENELESLEFEQEYLNEKLGNIRSRMNILENIINEIKSNRR